MPRVTVWVTRQTRAAMLALDNPPVWSQVAAKAFNKAIAARKRKSASKRRRASEVRHG